MNQFDKCMLKEYLETQLSFKNKDLLIFASNELPCSHDQCCTIMLIAYICYICKDIDGFTSDLKNIIEKHSLDIPL